MPQIDNMIYNLVIIFGTHKENSCIGLLLVEKT